MKSKMLKMEQVAKPIVIKELINRGVHIGHKTNKWNPKTTSFIFAKKNNIHIIDLEQTVIMMRRALNFINEVCQKRGNISYLFNVSVADEEKKLENQSKGQTAGTKKKRTGRPEVPTFSNRESQTAILKGKRLPEALCAYGGATKEKMSANFFREAIKLQIPIIGILDSNSNPFGIQYPIPGNDESVEARNLYHKLVKNAIS